MKTTDVHAPLAENCPDLPDHTRHVAVARHQHVTLRRRFEMKTINLRDASFASLFAVTEQRSGNTARRTSRRHLSAHRGGGVATRAHVSRRHFDTAFFGDQKRVDDDLRAREW